MAKWYITIQGEGDGAESLAADFVGVLGDSGMSVTAAHFVDADSRDHVARSLLPDPSPADA